MANDQIWTSKLKIYTPWNKHTLYLYIASVAVSWPFCKRFVWFTYSHWPEYSRNRLIKQCHWTEHGCGKFPWWRHQVETFPRYWPFRRGISPVSGEFHAQRPVTRSFDVFFDLCPNKRLTKQSWGWWFETPSGPLWRHSNANFGLPH